MRLIAEVVCDHAASVGGCEWYSRSGLRTPASRRTTSRRRLIERDFKDASEAGEAQLYGFDFD